MSILRRPWGQILVVRFHGYDTTPVSCSLPIGQDAGFEILHIGAVIDPRIRQTLKVDIGNTGAMPATILPLAVVPPITLKPGDSIMVSLSHQTVFPWWKFWLRWARFNVQIELQGNKLYSDSAATPGPRETTELEKPK